MCPSAGNIALDWPLVRTACTGEGAGPGRGEVRRGDRLRGLRLLRAGGAHHQRGGAHLPQELPHPAQPPQGEYCQ